MPGAKSAGRASIFDQREPRRQLSRQIDADFGDPAAVRVAPADEAGTSVPEIVDRLDSYGFAIIAMPWAPTGRVACQTLAGWLGLGDLVVPAAYLLPGAEEYANTYADVVSREAGRHPGFSMRSAQPMHVDGLLDEPGAIRVSTLYCVRPGVSGGQTIFFNALLAHYQLGLTDPAACRALENPRVLRRFSTLPGVIAHRDGPAIFADDTGAVISRFCDGDTEEWMPQPGEEEALARALVYFRELAATTGRCLTKVALQAGECAIFRNDRLSHGRESYEDDPDSPRHLVRALYANEPTSPGRPLC